MQSWSRERWGRLCSAPKVRSKKEKLRSEKRPWTRVQMRNGPGRQRSQGAHETVRVARCSDVFAIAENNRGPSTQQADPAIGYFCRSKLSRGISRPQQIRMERPGRATWTVTPLRVGRRANQFIAKCGDSLRELEETAYWLELLVEGKIVPAETVAAIRQECDELIAIFVTILKRSKEPFQTS